MKCAIRLLIFVDCIFVVCCFCCCCCYDYCYYSLSVFFFVVFGVENSIQETDGGYFEAFTALAWKRDNRRMSAVRTAETRAEMIPEKEHDAQASEEINDTPDEKEQLYIEVLQCIANAVGAPAPGGQVCIAIH